MDFFFITYHSSSLKIPKFFNSHPFGFCFHFHLFVCPILEHLVRDPHIWFLLAYPPHSASLCLDPIFSSHSASHKIPYQLQQKKKKTWTQMREEQSRWSPTDFLTFLFPCDDLCRTLQRHQAFLFFFPSIPNTHNDDRTCSDDQTSINLELMQRQLDLHKSRIDAATIGLAQMTN